MKLIFLDIDGVLNTNDNICYRTQRERLALESGKTVNYTHDKYGYLFDARAVNWLGLAIAKTGAKIVISSTWRYSGLAEMQALWADRKLPGEVVGITPSYRHDNTLNPFKGSPYEEYRGAEIYAYLKDRTDVDGYAIVDDDTDMLPTQLRHFVKTDAEFGITHRSAELIINALCTPIKL